MPTGIFLGFAPVHTSISTISAQNLHDALTNNSGAKVFNEYVRVRTYKTVDGTKYYSGWSTYKYVKTK